MTTDLIVLESHISSLFDTVRKSSLMFKDFQSFEMRLFSLNSLADMIGYFLDNAKAVFDLDQVTLCLHDEYGDFSRILGEESCNLSDKQGMVLLCDKDLLKAKFGYMAHSYVGSFDLEHFGHFFTPLLEASPSSIAIIPLYRRGRYFGTLNLGSCLSDRFSCTKTTDFIAYLGMVIGICFENHLNLETIRRTSYIDTLTGVNNRRFLEQRIGEELDRCQRNDDPLTCLFLDIDYFKSVNDKYGHQVGNKVLSTVAKTIKSQLRNNDVLVRYGGEEFIALLTNINQSKGFEIAERIRRNVQSLKITFNETTVPVTLSIGLSTYQSDRKHPMTTAEAAARLIDTADSAMYQAKNKGRNRIECTEIALDRPLALNG
ncbi:diguanylate cyclase [Methylomicrobium sp. Wu6]|uniref:GGDEF domain-containing protein n=1 Tax=Methylomicrobium sp. Wu6 TaxID=3107928 RepID=UPI002DD6410E|nr:diguanylate cyclase [Methylomicrobium sp. Wu6]MEC4748676.1 diguanylate cyclase [Methylomicrobium sp. Wu6]